MGGGREYTGYQRKIINRYYDNIDTIVVTRLGEIVTDMALAQGDQKKLDRLWKRAEQALEKVRDKEGNPDPGIRKVLDNRDVEGLAALVQKLA